MAKNILRVFPNPYMSLDQDGYPAGVCPCDMPHHVGMTVRKFVGARLDPEATMLLERLSKDELVYRTARQQTRFVFDLQNPTEIPLTEYYRDRLRSGELICADKESHALAEMTGDFVSAKEILAKSKENAIKEWRLHHGPDSKPEGIDSLERIGSTEITKPDPPNTESKNKSKGA